jgi:hypothetical protein
VTGASAPALGPRRSQRLPSRRARGAASRSRTLCRGRRHTCHGSRRRLRSLGRVLHSPPGERHVHCLEASPCACQQRGGEGHQQPAERLYLLNDRFSRSKFDDYRRPGPGNVTAEVNNDTVVCRLSAGRMTCAPCVRRIEKALSKVEGVKGRAAQPGHGCRSGRLQPGKGCAWAPTVASMMARSSSSTASGVVVWAATSVHYVCQSRVGRVGVVSAGEGRPATAPADLAATKTPPRGELETNGSRPAIVEEMSPSKQGLAGSSGRGERPPTSSGPTGPGRRPA